MQICNIRGLNGITRPPPLNATNLLDISHALEAVNITQQQRTSLGVGSTDVLGQILETIETSINSKFEQLESLVSEKGNCRCYVGQYTGNGQNKLSITFDFLPMLYISRPKNDIAINSMYSIVYVYNSKYCTAICSSYSDSASVSISGTTLTFSGSATNASNANNNVYTYIALG